MAKSTLLLLRPQFFQTLLPGFQTQLMIPSDFFSNYIKETSLDSETTTTAELKSDSSDITWKVELTGRILNHGWGDFAVANNLQIGNVVLVRYEGDLVFHVSDLGPSFSQIQHIKPPPQNTNDDDDESLMEKIQQKQRPVSYSSCHKRFVTFTLPPDYATICRLTLPNLFVKENGINKPEEIRVLGKDGTKWPISLLLDKKGIMSLGKGWKEFVKANGLETGFTLKLMWEDTAPSFSLCCAASASDRDEEAYLESIKKQSLSIDRRIRDKSSKDERRSWEREKIHLGGDIEGIFTSI